MNIAAQPANRDAVNGAPSPRKIAGNQGQHHHLPIQPNRLRHLVVEKRCPNTANRKVVRSHREAARDVAPRIAKTSEHLVSR